MNKKIRFNKISEILQFVYFGWREQFYTFSKIVYSLYIQGVISLINCSKHI